MIAILFFVLRHCLRHCQFIIWVHLFPFTCYSLLVCLILQRLIQVTVKNLSLFTVANHHGFNTVDKYDLSRYVSLCMIDVFFMP